MIPNTQDRRIALRQAAQRLAGFGPLSQADMDAIQHLPGDLTIRRRGEEAPAPGLHLIVSGWACKMRPVAVGQRQIFVFLLPGDFIGPFMPRSDVSLYSTVALTRLETLDMSSLVAPMAEGEPAMPDIARAGQVFEDHAQGLIFDHMVRLGARDAYSGLADLLMELKERLARAGQVSEDGAFTLPIGQRVLAHALGVSVVHVNQTLKRLAGDGLIEIDGPSVRLTDPQRIAALGDFHRPVNDSALADTIPARRREMAGADA